MICSYTKSVLMIIHINIIINYFYRLLVQLEETEKQFDNFWQKHSTKLNHWLKFRTFLLNFKQMQVLISFYIYTYIKTILNVRKLPA